jgi:hypothetical protein
MSEVQANFLEAHQTFPNREILSMRVAEEANLRGINILYIRSNNRDLRYTGTRFCVTANQSKRLGCYVAIANVRECDDHGPAAVVDVDKAPEKLTSPFKTKWIVPLILPIIVQTPAISNKNLRQALSAYGSDTSLSDSILQEARSEAKAQLFGTAKDNVKYAEGMKSELQKNGHTVELVYTTQKETLRNVERVVIG